MPGSSGWAQICLFWITGDYGMRVIASSCAVFWALVTYQFLNWVGSKSYLYYGSCWMMDIEIPTIMNSILLRILVCMWSWNKIWQNTLISPVLNNIHRTQITKTFEEKMFKISWRDSKLIQKSCVIHRVMYGYHFLKRTKENKQAN